MEATYIFERDNSEITNGGVNYTEHYPGITFYIHECNYRALQALNIQRPFALSVSPPLPLSLCPSKLN